MLYRKAQVSDRWLRAPLQAPTALHQPLSYISRSHIADVFASQENGRKDISVCFTGHRAIPPQELPALTERLDRHCISTGFGILSAAARWDLTRWQRSAFC